MQEATVFFEYQTKVIHSKYNAITCLETALEEQVKLQPNEFIPFRYTPKLLYTEENQLSDHFLAQYKQLFESYLSKVIKTNQIHLQKHKTELKEILENIDKQAAQLKITDEALSLQYTKFIEQNNIEGHLAAPELQKRINVAPIKLGKRNRRRKRTNTTKKSKLTNASNEHHHFLLKS